MKLFYPLSLVWAMVSCPLMAQVTTYDYTGGMQTYVVPGGVNYIQIETWGAQGGGSENCSSTVEEDGGLGGYSTGNLYVTPGETYYIYVGGKPSTSLGGPSSGGYNGGGASGQYAGGGGGASDVRFGGTALANRIIVAGGGGGGNTGCPDHGTGGNGGGYVGSNGINLSGGFAIGMGGTAVAGGAGGGTGSAGALGVGGTGAYHVAGGGGGYYGGGGAYAAGGGGGSSYTDGVLDGATTGGLQTGDGQIIITVLCNPLTVTASAEMICLGDSLTLEATSESGAFIIWSDGIENGVPFVPETAGYVTYSAVSSDGDDCEAIITILVYPAPNVIAHVDVDLICEGMEVVLHGTGAGGYVWSPADVIDDEPFTPPLGLSTYIVTGTTGLGCVNSDTITLEVFETPNVIASVSKSFICYGETVLFSGSGADTYEWSPGAIENGVPYTPETTGEITYILTGTNDTGCENSDMVTVTMNPEIIVTSTTIGEEIGGDGAIDITVSGGTPTYSFDWDNDGTGDFDDTEDLTGLAGGTYTVIIKDSEGCTLTESVLVSSQLGVNELSEALINVFPNPTTNQITLNLNGNYAYSVYTVSGDLVLTGQGSNQSKLDLTQFEIGVYILKVNTTERTASLKITKI